MKMEIVIDGRKVRIKAYRSRSARRRSLGRFYTSLIESYRHDPRGGKWAPMFSTISSCAKVNGPVKAGNAFAPKG